MKNIRKMNKNLQITEDWEREALKDFIYLHEEKQLISDEIHRELHRKPAIITVVDKHNILDKQHEHHSNALPF
jgi:hypothetical protein